VKAPARLPDDRPIADARESGVAGEIRRSTIGGITLCVGTGTKFEHPTVLCFFDDSQTKAVTRLSSGDRVRLRGRVEA
jgi:hypothetical protein